MEVIYILYTHTYTHDACASSFRQQPSNKTHFDSQLARIIRV